VAPTKISSEITHISDAPAGSVAMTNADASGGTPSQATDASASLDSAPAISLDTAATAGLTMDSYTPTGQNTVSSVKAFEELVDMFGVTAPTLALVHDADPVVNLAAAPLYAIIHVSSVCRVGRLESNQASTTDTTFTTANDGVFYATGTLRATGFVRHAVGSLGIQLFVDEADSYKIKANITTGDFYLTLYMGGIWVDVRVYDAPTAGMKPLYYDDNGVDNAKLCFVAGDTSNHNTGSAIGKVQQSGHVDGMELGQAAGQVFTGDADTLTGSVSVTDAVYESDTPAITVVQPTYNALGNHSHANTAALTGSTETTTIIESTPADSTYVYITVTTSATALKIKVLAI